MVIKIVKLNVQTVHFFSWTAEVESEAVVRAVST